MSSGARSSNARTGSRGARTLLLVGALLLTSIALGLAATSAWGKVVPNPATATAATAPNPSCAPTATACGQSPFTTAPAGGATGGVQQGASSGIVSPSSPPAGNDPLAGDSPFCIASNQLDATAQNNCRLSGSIAQPYPIGNYGLDVPQASVTNPLNIIEAGFASFVISPVWTVLVWGVHGVLVLLEWAFALDLVNLSMGAVTNDVNFLHGNLFGHSWELAAVAIVGLWGIWNGLIRSKVIETIGGLLATVALMLGALVLIANPAGTIGRFSNEMNQASLTALSAAGRGTVNRPVATFADMEGGVFNALVVGPWCELEFGDAGYCLAPHRVSPHQVTTVADIWLSFPANSPYRQGLYRLTGTGSTSPSTNWLERIMRFNPGVYQDPTTGQPSFQWDTPQWEFSTPLTKQCKKDYPTGNQCSQLTLAPKVISRQPQMVNMQSAGDTVTRFALLCFIAAQLIGAILLLGWLGLKLLFAAVKILLLVLALPVIMFLPVFGQSGRAGCLACGKRLAGSLIAKLVFALALALVLFVDNVLNQLPIGWVGLSLVSTVFWWGLFFERRQVIGLMTADRRTGDLGLDVAAHGAPFRVAGALLTGLAAARVIRGTARAAAALPRAVGRRSVAHQTASTLASRDGFRDEVAERAGGAIRLDDAARKEAGQKAVAMHDYRQERIDQLRRDRIPLRESARDDPDNQKLVDEHDLIIKHQEDLFRAEQRAVNHHQATLDAMKERNRWEDPGELRKEIEQRQADVSPGMAFPTTSDRPGLDRSLRWAGIDPRDFDAADPSLRHSMIERATSVWERDRDLSNRLGDPRAGAGLRDSRVENRQARREVRARGPEHAERHARRSSAQFRAMKARRQSRPRR
jgi:hypothetical protein